MSQSATINRSHAVNPSGSIDVRPPRLFSRLAYHRGPPSEGSTVFSGRSELKKRTEYLICGFTMLILQWLFAFHSLIHAFGTIFHRERSCVTSFDSASPRFWSPGSQLKQQCPPNDESSCFFPIHDSSRGCVSCFTNIEACGKCT